jgi:hypothetical protein
MANFFLSGTYCQRAFAPFAYALAPLAELIQFRVPARFTGDRRYSRLI